MKRAKKYHLGESLQDIIKRQEDTDPAEMFFPAESVETSTENKAETKSAEIGTTRDKPLIVKDIMTGEEFTEDGDDIDALTIVEDLDEATKKILGTDKHIPEPLSQKKPEDLKRDIILSEIQFNRFYFYEREDRFELIIPKMPGEINKHVLENAFVEVITEISDVNQFLIN